jgi:hypothetical protein
MLAGEKIVMLPSMFILAMVIAVGGIDLFLGIGIVLIIASMEEAIMVMTHSGVIPIMDMVDTMAVLPFIIHIGLIVLIGIETTETTTIITTTMAVGILLIMLVEEDLWPTALTEPLIIQPIQVLI